MFRTGVERLSTGLTPKATQPRELRPGRSVQQTASTSLRASQRSWSTIESKIWQHFLKALREEACNVLEKTDDSEYGKFGWVMDPEGNKVELWQPPQEQ